MATPRILLSSSAAPDVNNWIPPSYAKNHAKLICAAKELFAQEFPGDDWDVHFHLAALDVGAMTCTARLAPSFWNRGDYFTQEFTMTNELYLYAHFEQKVAENAGSLTFVQPAMDPCSFEANIGLLEMQQVGESVIPSPYFESGSFQPLDLSFWSPSFPGVEVAKTQPVPEKKSKNTSKAKGKAESLQDLELGPVGKRTRSSKAHVALYRASAFYPALPAAATPESFVKDKELAMTDNTRDEFFTSDRTLESLSHARVGAIARARLIASQYGVEARKPCDTCKAQNKNCRIFHPILFTEPWKAAKRNGALDTGRCACCTNGSRPGCNAE